jgi:AbrB family looped-hinge helix DNA binding protein
MLAKLSSKGQLIIPKSVRDCMRLEPGTRFHVEIVEERIVLEPIRTESPIEALYGLYRGHDLLGELEAEHAREVQHD